MGFLKGKIVFIFIVVFVISSFSNLGFADDIKGYMIPEYYSVISHHDGEDNKGKGFYGRVGYEGESFYLPLTTFIMALKEPVL